MEPPFFAHCGPRHYRDRDVEVVDNTPEEIRDTVVEMIRILDGEAVHDAAYRKRRDAYNAVSSHFRPVVNSSIAKSFLDRHPELLD